MNINRALLEASAITKHFMTREEQAVKKQLCQLLIDRGHTKYARRFWMLDFNIIDSKKHPEFTAAISFDEATVFVSDGFLGSGQGIFNQLDVLLRHEMAHNLMMHQIRLMYVFKKLHANDPEEAYTHISYSSTLHDLLNIIEDYEISNKRYSPSDKDIVRNMQLNGEIIGGLVTEDDRGWEKMTLEQMYEELTKELIQINSDIRSNPYWQPRTKVKHGKDVLDSIDYSTAKAVKLYSNVMKPSGIRAPIDVFMKSKIYKQWPDAFQKLVKKVYDELKDFTNDPEKQFILDMISDIAVTSPQETFDVCHPKTGKVIVTLYTPENKLIVMDILKNITGNINYDPLKFNVKRKTNTQEYKNAWNEIIKQLDSKKFDDETLQQLRNAIEAM
jgi:hypothetical protein